MSNSMVWGNNWSMGNQRSGMSNNWGMSNNMVWCSVDSVVHWLSNIWDSLSLIPDVSNESILVVSMVGDNLHTAIGKLYSVFSLDNSMFILSLSLGKVSAVLISSSVLVGKWLRRDLLLVVRCWGRMIRSGGIWSRCWGVSNISWSSHGCSNKERGDKCLHC